MLAYQDYSYLLYIAAFLTSVISGVLGMGGGIILLAVMASFFPMQLLVPLHGLIQLASNSVRTALHFKNVDRKIFIQFSLGALLGGYLGTQYIFFLPDYLYKILLAAIILYFTFYPKRTKPSKFQSMNWPIIGTIATYVSLYIGATGPLLAPFFLREKLRKEQIIGSKASCQFVTHFLKMIAYFASGFSIGVYSDLLITMVLCVIIGNFVGKKILHHVSEKWFLFSFKGIIVLLSLKLIYEGIIILF